MLSPMVLGLVAAEALVAWYAVYAAITGTAILIRWEPGSPKEDQLKRERRTALVSSILGHLMFLEILLLGVFVAIADELHSLLTGAMCAAGTLNASGLGYPALLVMLAGSVLSGLWLVLNRLDARAPDFPLIRVKYGVLPLLALVFVAQAVLVIRFLAELDPEFSTSCCASVFDSDRGGFGSEVAHLSAGLIQPLFWGGLVVTVLSGVLSPTRRGLRWLFTGLSALMLPVALAGVIGFISLAYYQLPTHHCPFCLLHAEYGRVGYLLYTSLLVATTAGMATGMVSWCGRSNSLQPRIPAVLRSLRRWSLAGYATFVGAAAWPFITSGFRLSY